MSDKKKFSVSDLTILIIALIIIIPTIYVGINKGNSSPPTAQSKNRSKSQCESDYFLKNLDSSMISHGRQYINVIEFLKTKTNIYGKANHFEQKVGNSKYHIYVFPDKSKIQFEFQQEKKKDPFKLFQVTAME